MSSILNDISVPSVDTKCSINDEPTIELSLVVPAYNEELRLGAMLDPTLAFLQSWCGQQKMSFEVVLYDKCLFQCCLLFKVTVFFLKIIIVDDGSKDQTQRVIAEYMEVPNNCIRCLKLGVNRGKGEAVRRGVQRSRGRYILMVLTD